MTKPTGKPVGRPPGRKYTERLAVDITKAQKASLAAQARAKGITGRELMRQWIDGANPDIGHHAEQKRLIRQHRLEIERLMRDGKKLNEKLGALLASDVFL